MNRLATLLVLGVFIVIPGACATSSSALAPTPTGMPLATAIPPLATTATPGTPAPASAEPLSAAATQAPATPAPGEVLATKVANIVGTWQLADFANAPYYVEFKADGTYVGSYDPATPAPFDIAGTDKFEGTTFGMRDSTSGHDKSCAGFDLSFNVIVAASAGHPKYLRFVPLNDACVVHEGGQSLSRADLYARRPWLWVQR